VFDRLREQSLLALDLIVVGSLLQRAHLARIVCLRQFANLILQS
jgi:hypothetical protein